MIEERNMVGLGYRTHGSQQRRVSDSPSVQWLVHENSITFVEIGFPKFPRLM